MGRFGCGQRAFERGSAAQSQRRGGSITAARWGGRLPPPTVGEAARVWVRVGVGRADASVWVGRAQENGDMSMAELVIYPKIHPSWIIYPKFVIP
jgi:hypothetical protein